MKKQPKYSPGVIERAVRMVSEAASEYESQWAAITQDRLHAYYYAHLDRYADGIKEGMIVKRGDVIGYVGVPGNSDPNAPHLHFAVFELTPEKQWWKGTPLNPFPLMSDGQTVAAQ